MASNSTTDGSFFNTMPEIPLGHRVLIRMKELDNSSHNYVAKDVTGNTTNTMATYDSTGRKEITYEVPINANKTWVDKYNANVKVLNNSVFYLLDSFTMGVDSEFSEPFKSVVSSDLRNFMVGIQGIMKNSPTLAKYAQYASLDNKAFSYAQWKSTTPLRINMTIRCVAMYKRKEGGGYALYGSSVPDQIKALMKCCLPIASNLGQMIAPGPNMFTLLSKKSGTSVGGADTTAIYVYANGMFFNNVIFTSVRPNFSSEIDEHGYPLYCDIQCGFSSITTAHYDMIDDMFDSYKSTDSTWATDSVNYNATGINRGGTTE